jgi:RNA polymerase-binding transcription factor DksA
VKEVEKLKAQAKAMQVKSAEVQSQNTEYVLPEVDMSKAPHYPDKDLEMFEIVIQEAKREAMDELRMLKERLEDLNSYDLAEESMIYSMHMGEQGSEPMEKEKTYAQIQRSNEYLKKLDDALNRIKDKTYGICRVCGILIAKERLLAVPITTLSASWKIHQRCPADGVDRIEAVK